jgi:3-dehydroquinate dehydratase II
VSLANQNRLSLLVLHGPNLNLLGLREPGIYGITTLEQINRQLVIEGEKLETDVIAFQSNYEGALVEAIHQAYEVHQGIIINAGAYTHTSVAIRDAISGVKIPTVEVHLSNIYQRESFRHHSYISAVAIGQISGFGADSYLLGLQALVRYLRREKGLGIGVGT